MAKVDNIANFAKKLMAHRQAKIKQVNSGNPVGLKPPDASMFNFGHLAKLHPKARKNILEHMHKESLAMTGAQAGPMPPDQGAL